LTRLSELAALTERLRLAKAGYRAAAERRKQLLLQIRQAEKQPERPTSMAEDPPNHLNRRTSGEE